MYAKEAMDLIEYSWLLRRKFYINHDTNLHVVHHGLHTHSIVLMIYITSCTQVSQLVTNYSHFSLKYFCWQLNLKTYRPPGPKIVFMKVKPCSRLGYSPWIRWKPPQHTVRLPQQVIRTYLCSWVVRDTLGVLLKYTTYESSQHLNTDQSIECQMH